MARDLASNTFPWHRYSDKEFGSENSKAYRSKMDYLIGRQKGRRVQQKHEKESQKRNCCNSLPRNESDSVTAENNHHHLGLGERSIGMMRVIDPDQDIR